MKPGRKVGDERKREQDRAAQERRRARMRVNGLCYDCGGMARPKRVLCGVCSGDHVNATRRRLYGL